MFFTLPWMLLGLFGLPTVAAIYWLRSRAQPRTVSSLFLWQDQRRPKQGGRVVERLQTPLMFFLELLAIAALAMAAAGPAFTYSHFARPIVLVLDDSYSMLAGGESSPRSRAVQKLTRELRKSNYVARIILAGTETRLLGVTVRTPEELTEALKDWTCRSSAASLDSATTLAGEVGGSTSRILVISDNAPPVQLGEGKLEWWSEGEPLPNIAVTAASRDAVEGSDGRLVDRVLFEISNFSEKPVRTDLVLDGADLRGPSRRTIELEAGAASRLIFNVPNGSKDLKAKLSYDSLVIDNDVVLVSPRRKPLRVQLMVKEGDTSASDLRLLLDRAFRSTTQALLVDSRPDLVVTDQASENQTAGYQLEFLTGPDPVSYDGPFILDRSHRLTEGMSLDAVVWSVPREATVNGNPLISAGNRVLLGESENLQGQHRLQMALDSVLSNLTETPDWPIFTANLVRWCLESVPGPSAANVRLGQNLEASFPIDPATPVKIAALTLPDQTQRSLPLQGNSIEFQAEQVGLYAVKAEETRYEIACNALNADESNLQKCETGRWGNWNLSETYQDQRAHIDWGLILFALGCLATRHVLLSRLAVGGT